MNSFSLKATPNLASPYRSKFSSCMAFLSSSLNSSGFSTGKAGLSSCRAMVKWAIFYAIFLVIDAQSVKSSR